MLRDFASKADEVVPSIVKALDSANSSDRSHAAQLLAALGPQVPLSTSDLIHLLKVYAGDVMLTGKSNEIIGLRWAAIELATRDEATDDSHHMLVQLTQTLFYQRDAFVGTEHDETFKTTLAQVGRMLLGVDQLDPTALTDLLESGELLATSSRFRDFAISQVEEADAQVQIVACRVMLDSDQEVLHQHAVRLVHRIGRPASSLLPTLRHLLESTSNEQKKKELEDAIRQVTSEGSKEMRTWTDASGRFTVRAELVGLKADKLTLRKADGSLVTVPVDRMSEDDRSYLQSIGTNDSAND